MAGYLYEGDGAPTWFVASGQVVGNILAAVPMQTFEDGQTFTGPYRVPAARVASESVALQFTSVTRATLTWSRGQIPLQRFEFAPVAGVPYPESGWWWNPNENGRGFSIEIVGNTLAMAAYLYDETGAPTWYLSSGPMMTPTHYRGTWQLFSDGQALGAPYRAPVVRNADAGSVDIIFVSPRDAVLTLPDGRQIAITRFVF